MPAADDELRKQADAFGKQANCTVRVDTIAHLQMPAKLAAEAQSQSGHDMYRTASADTFLYEQQLVSLDDVVEKLAKQYGGWYPFAAEMNQTKSGWKGVPWFWISFPGTYNMAHFSSSRTWSRRRSCFLALIVTYPTFLVPFCTWLLMGYFRTIPREVEECALVDGATRMQTLQKIVLPMAVPGIICAPLFSFTLCWNEFTYGLTFISQSAHKTAVVGVTADLIRGDIYYWGSLMAGAVLASVPVVVCYVLFLDYHVSGLTAGAVKG